MLGSGDVIIHYSNDWERFKRRSAFPVQKDNVIYKCMLVSISPEPSILHFGDYEIKSKIIQPVKQITPIK